MNTFQSIKKCLVLQIRLFPYNVLLISDLVFVGEARFGVKMKAKDLQRCVESSNSAEKLALNLLEFLVSKDDCQEMTMYGHGKKKSMEPNLRRAIKCKFCWKLNSFVLSINHSYEWDLTDFRSSAVCVFQWFTFDWIFLQFI